MTAADRSPFRRLTGAGPSPSIGVLIDRLDDSGYQSTILRGAVETARNSGAHLLCFAGGVLEGAPGEGAERNGIFDLARARNVDALIILSGSVGKRIGARKLGAFCDSLGPMPICSVAVDLERTSSLCIDNEGGMRVVIEHLIRVHDIRDIAFIRGPEANEEAERRYGVYRSVLQAEGIAFRKELVALGNFEPSSGARAVDTFFGGPQPSPGSIRAIVAANDSMSLGAMDALRRRGLRIPEQVAVVGFDDVEEARFALPPLTTVRQPLYDQGRNAVRIVLEQLRDGARPERVVRPTELVTRRSCGCLALSSTPARVSGRPTARVGFDAAVIRSRQVMLAEMTRAARGELSGAGADWGERLLNAFVEQVRGDSPDAFFRAYDDLLRRLETSAADSATCNNVMSALRAATLRSIGDEAVRRGRAEDVFHEAALMTARFADRLQVARRLSAVRYARGLGRATAAVASSRTEEDLRRAVREHLPALGIARAFVIEQSREGSESRTARVTLAEGPGGRGVNGKWVAAHDVLRQQVLSDDEDQAFAVLPMSAGDHGVGAVVLEIGADDYAYETLREVFEVAWAQVKSRSC